MQIWKLGGSLFDLPDLRDRIWRLHRHTAIGTPVAIIPGGGALAEAIREWDRTHRLNPGDSHHLALDCMRTSARFVGAMLEVDYLRIHRLAQPWMFRGWTTVKDDQAPLEVFDIVDYWNNWTHVLAAEYGEIPEDWTLTSDSMAAVLAAHWHAEKLVLLKSVDCPENSTAEDWSAAQLVDEAFARFAPFVKKIEWVNLRSPGLLES